MSDIVIETERLILRTWREADIEPFQIICSDPVVMATLGDPLSLDEARETVDRQRKRQADYGHCFWALERREDQRLIGWCGVIRGATGPVDGKVEAGWRLASDCWGKGYVSEAARASLDWAFAELADDEVYAITSKGNRRSQAVMERLGMRYRADLDFEHPGVPHYSVLAPHVTYCVTRGEFRTQSPSTGMTTR